MQSCEGSRVDGASLGWLAQELSDTHPGTTDQIHRLSVYRIQGSTESGSDGGEEFVTNCVQTVKKSVEDLLDHETGPEMLHGHSHHKHSDEHKTHHGGHRSHHDDHHRGHGDHRRHEGHRSHRDLHDGPKPACPESQRPEQFENPPPYEGDPYEDPGHKSHYQYDRDEGTDWPALMDDPNARAMDRP
jgi:hypothetical protein